MYTISAMKHPIEIKKFFEERKQDNSTITIFEAFDKGWDAAEKSLALEKSLANKCSHSYWFRCKCGQAICNKCGQHYQENPMVKGKFCD